MIKKAFSVASIIIFLLTTSVPMDSVHVKNAEPAEPVITETLQNMSQYDYIKNSVTGLSSVKLSDSALKKAVAKYGTLYYTGMPYTAYKEAMGYEWTDCTDYKDKPVKINIDITKTMDYKAYVSILKKLSRYDGIYLYKIGESQKGRNVYAIEINVESNKEKDVIMFTGQVHAREFAGGIYLVKMFADLIQKAQTDKNTMNLLRSYKYVSIPIINVDGREGLIKNPMDWTTTDGMWKAYANGTDGNRNFPGVIWGEVSRGNKLKWNIRLQPGSDNYAGKSAGSCPETRALMKFLYHYIVVEKAVCLFDLHQQGSGVYAGKLWSTKTQENASNKLRSKVIKLLNVGNTRSYKVMEDEVGYGLNGTGSTITDYAVSVATGAKFSPAMGFCVYTDGKKEYMLMQISDLDDVDFKVVAPNPIFITLTIEIGYGKCYLGNSPSTRRLLAKEYTKYHFDTLLETLPKIL